MSKLLETLNLYFSLNEVEDLYTTNMWIETFGKLKTSPGTKFGAAQF